jgi:hypothetical protein
VHRSSAASLGGVVLLACGPFIEDVAAASLAWPAPADMSLQWRTVRAHQWWLPFTGIEWQQGNSWQPHWPLNGRHLTDDVPYVGAAL